MKKVSKEINQAQAKLSITETVRKVVHCQLSIALLTFGLVLAGCSKSNGDDDSDDPTNPTSATEDPNLEKVLPLLRHTLYVKAEYDKGNKPSYITNSSNKMIASISYNPNGALGEVRSNSSNLSSIFLYSQPLFISEYGQTAALDNGITGVAYGPDGYDYAANPAKAIGLFQNGVAADCNFTTLDNLKRLSNNSAITEDLFSKISYPSGGHSRLIIFGKNKAGTLIGKYVGYLTTIQSPFTYWCIDPESSSFGVRATKTLPNN
ncbi:hypothetical protein FACS189430_08350 [Bacteroidia bacterium]|nr:hypothetical protein FACS189430_08350 [Bacteroidia bacterium]